MDNLASLLKAYGGAAVNDDVKSKILELIQTWATATEGRHELSYIGETYRSLQRDGFHFPPKIDVAKSMVDSSAVSSYAVSAKKTGLINSVAPRMVRFRCLYAMQVGVQLHKPKTPLQELWKRLRPAVLEQSAPPSPHWHSATRQG